MPSLSGKGTAKAVVAKMVNVLNFIVKDLDDVAELKVDGLDIQGGIIALYAAFYTLRAGLQTRLDSGACQLCDTGQRCMEGCQNVSGILLLCSPLGNLRM